MSNLLIPKQYTLSDAEIGFSLTLEQQPRFQMWLNKLMSRYPNGVPAWKYAILVGCARRLARNPPTSAWGRSMLAKRGGLALQRKLKLEGKHPTAYATKCRVEQAKTITDEDRKWINRIRRFRIRRSKINQLHKSNRRIDPWLPAATALKKVEQMTRRQLKGG